MQSLRIWRNIEKEHVYLINRISSSSLFEIFLYLTLPYKVELVFRSILLSLFLYFNIDYNPIVINLVIIKELNM